MAVQLGPVPTTDEKSHVRQNTAIQQLFGRFSKLVVWENTPTVKSGTYVVVNGDAGSTLALGGGACYTVTFNAPSTYVTDFLVFVQNTDSTRAKVISLNGTLIFLWPLQGGFVFTIGGNWYNTFPARWGIPGGMTFYVNPGGNDANDGLASGASNALLNIQTAVDRIHSLVDPTPGGAFIRLDDGTYSLGTGAVEIDYAIGSGQIQIIGNTTTPGNVVITVTTGTCFIIQEPATVSLSGMTLVSSGSGATGVFIRQFATCDLEGVTFGAFAGGIHIVLTDFASCNITNANYAITGSAVAHIDADLHSSLQFPASITCTVSGGLTFSFFIILGNESVAELGGTYAGAGAGAGTTAQQWILSALCVLDLGGSVVPGNVAGVPASGAALVKAGIVNP